MIKVKYSKGLFMIWNANDAVEIRQKHRIIGSLIGTLPAHPRQNDINGLPLILSNEEIRLLHSLNVVTIVEQSFSSELNDNKELLQYHNELNEKYRKEMKQKLIDERIEQIKSNIDKIVDGKLKKLQIRIENEDEREKYRQSILEEMLSSIKQPSDKDLDERTRFYTESPYKQFKIVKIYELPSLESMNRLDKLKYLTFKYFWTRGYYLTNGLKFGAHFLCYDHDPILFHAKFIIYCCHNSIEFDCFKERMIQAYGRLGKNVRKNIIIVHFVNDSDDDIQLEHVQWNPMLFNEDQQIQ